jgi:hypothetical protein
MFYQPQRRVHLGLLLGRESVIEFLAVGAERSGHGLLVARSAASVPGATGGSSNRRVCDSTRKNHIRKAWVYH